MSEKINTNVLLNQIEVRQWNYEAIDKEFDIYQIILDSPTARNVLNTQLMILSRRRKELRKLFGYRQRSLLQLLINYTLNSVFPEQEYQNITGRCYYYNKDWNDNPERKIELIDLTLEKDMVMYPSVATFIKTKPVAVRYVEKVVYDLGSMSIRKALKNDPENVIYYRQGIDGTHGTRAYDGTTLQYWEKSRMSCVARFFRTVRKELTPFVLFDFTTVVTKEISARDLTLGDEGIASVLRENGVCLVDSIEFFSPDKLDIRIIQVLIS